MRPPAVSGFFRHAGVMVAGSQAVNACNLLFHFLLVRMLDVEAYGVLASVIALTLYTGQLTLPLQPTLARFFARCRETAAEGEAARAVRRLTLALTVPALAVFIFFVLGAGFLAEKQNIADPRYLVLAGFLAGAGFFSVLPQAFLQGGQMFASLAGLNLASAAAKLLVAVGLVGLGTGAYGGLAGYIAGAAVVTFGGYGLIFRGRETKSQTKGESLRLGELARDYLPTAGFLLGFSLLTNLDLNLVKKFFSPQEAGYYAVAQMVGKIILYLPGAIAVVLFPKAAAAQAGGRPSFHLLVKGMAASAVLGLAGVAAAGAAPGPLLKLLTGKTSAASVELVFPFALAMFFYSLAWTAGFYNLSLRRMRFVAPVAGLAVLQAAAVWLHHPDLKSVVLIVAAGGFLTLAATLGFARSAREEGA